MGKTVLIVSFGRLVRGALFCLESGSGALGCEKPPVFPDVPEPGPRQLLFALPFEVLLSTGSPACTQAPLVFADSLSCLPPA